MIVNGIDLLQAAPIHDMVPRKTVLDGLSYGLGEAGYDIRIKQEVRFMANEEGAFVRVGDDPWKKGRFCLASAIELFDMPSDLVGEVKDKSSLARKGLQLFNTVIEPGWKGYLTLELVFHGEDPVTLPAGSPIAQVLFKKTTCHALYNGKYQDQEDQPVAARRE